MKNQYLTESKARKLNREESVIKEYKRVIKKNNKVSVSGLVHYLANKHNISESTIWNTIRNLTN